MSGPTELDSAWLAANPLPVHRGGTDKNSRGRVLAIGGAARVPGAIRLTGEAALRVGAGKLQMATLDAACATLGLLVPEAAVIGLPVDGEGELDASGAAMLATALERVDVAVFGPGMGDAAAAERLLRPLLAPPPELAALVLDAGAIGCAAQLRDLLKPLAGKLILTPHHGEMAQLTGIDADAIAADPAGVAARVAAEYGAIVALKASETVIAAPDGTLLHYAGGGVGLATGGSGDVLAGAVAGLASRGCSPLVAVAWGVWLHGQAGRRLATRRGPIGFLARELPAEFPHLLPQ